MTKYKPKKKDMSERGQLELVNIDANNLECILKAGIIPSEAVQLAAVNQNGFSIICLIETKIIPTEAV